MYLSTLRIEIPKKLAPLLKPKRYKGAYGGRGGAKSHFFAEQIIIRCYDKPTRVVCIREVQNSIKDSVKQLLVDKIAKLQMTAYFEVLDNEIRCNNGSIIIFRGMQSYNADNIKSLESYDIAWIEEAQTLSQHSLDMLRPTMRKDGSELWFSWNPRYKTDAVDMFFRKFPSEDKIAIEINWRDNPWFPEVLRKDMLNDFLVDEDKAEHIWNGAYGAGQGAILAKYVNKAERENRVHDNVEFDPDGSPIEISSDLGFRDTASWWYWQRKQGGFTLLMYDGESGLDADDWIERIQNNLIVIANGKLGKIWLPFDAKAKTFQSKHTVVDKFLSKFGTSKVSVVPQTKKQDQINAARAVLPKCEFHKTRCEAGLDGLMAWEYAYNEENGVFSREPLHNWASHPSDAFAYGCQVMQDIKIEVKTQPEFGVIAKSENEIQMPPLNDMWAQTSRTINRRL